jgi:adenosylcobinamide-phosphate guanylyltransferase
MIAIILAGGKNSRMRGQERMEKALITISGVRLIDLVVHSVQASEVDDFLVAISNNAARTADYCTRMKYKTIETPGKGYHDDVAYLLQRYPEFISVACDIPFLRGGHINTIIAAYDSHRISITGAVPRDIVPNGITPSYAFEHDGKQLVSCGINVVTSAKASIPLVFHDPLLAINVNTPADLSVARSMM